MVYLEPVKHWHLQVKEDDLVSVTSCILALCEDLIQRELAIHCRIYLHLRIYLFEHLLEYEDIVYGVVHTQYA